MTDEERGATLAEAERWFEQHGLPYFVAGNERRVRGALRRTRLAPVAVFAMIAGAAAGLGAGLTSGDVSTGVLVGALALTVTLVVYALVSLHLQSIVRWAVGQTFGSLSWLFPLITRALPLLLLFMTFLFINTEVWQVSSALDRGLLWLTVLLFAAVAVVFLLVQLPEEVRQVSAEASGDTLVRICEGTPVEHAASGVTGKAARHDAIDAATGELGPGLAVLAGAPSASAGGLGVLLLPHLRIGRDQRLSDSVLAG
ncbi:MAG: hypothetical protein WKF73_17105 [Nocardioidaceae bacterium]